MRSKLNVVAALVASAAFASFAAAGAGAATSGAIVKVAASPIGHILVDGRGITLYDFPPDQGTKSVCYGACAALWPPLLTKGKPVAISGSGVNPKLLGTTRRTDGKLQVTYNRHPLYLYKPDSKAGQINGEGANQFGGRWYIVGTNGNAIKPKSSGGLCNPLCPGY